MHKSTVGRIILSITTAINVLVATGFSISGIISPASMLPAGTETGEGAFIFSLYSAARTLPLAGLALFVIIARHTQSLIALAMLAGIVQVLDGIIGIYQQDVLKSIGPFFLAVAQFVATWIFWQLSKKKLEKK